MLKHFLSMFFFSTIFIVMFVNVFIFSGATLPMEVQYDSFAHENIQDTYFGFSSLIQFFESFAHDGYINASLKAFEVAWGMVKTFSIDSFVTMFKNLEEVSHQNSFGLVIAALFSGLLNIIITGLVQPVVYVIAVLGVIIALIIFIFALLSKLAQLFTGYYNIPMRELFESSGYIFINTFQLFLK